MPRQLRMERAGGCYHVINRGNYRRNLFEEDGAAELFERTLGEAAVRFGWRVHAYVVMRNHFHLALETPEPNLSVGMKWLQGTWVRRYNGFRRLVGRPFQGRFKALLVEPGHALAQVCHYIHLHPVRAHVCDADDIQSYRWSSLVRFPKKNRPPWLESKTVLFDAGQLPESTKGWAKYREYLAFRSIEKGGDDPLTRERMSRGWCIGSDLFREQARQGFENKTAALDLLRFAGLEPEELAVERKNVWETRLRALAKVAGVDLAGLPEKKSDRGKVLLAAAMKLSTSVSNRWLAERLRMGKPATVSQFVRRFLQDSGRKREVQLLLSIVKV